MNDQSLFDLARLPARDDEGYLHHPDLDQFMRDAAEGEDVYLDLAKLKAAGFEKAFVDLDGDDVDASVKDQYFEEGHGPISWTPTPPSGNGWLLVAIYDTEEGPYAMFIRPLDAGSAE